MNLKDHLAASCVILSQATTKHEALEVLADVLAKELDFDATAMLAAIREREALMSTGIGNGLAVPHVRMEKLKRAGVAVAVCGNGLGDYASMDDETVRIVVLIAAPQGEHDTYIKLLALTADVLRQETFRQKLLAAVDTQEIYQILTQN